MIARRPLSIRALLALLAFVGASALACTVPNQIEDGVSPDPKVIPEEGDAPEGDVAEAPPEGDAPMEDGAAPREGDAPAEGAPLAQAAPLSGEQECEQASRPIACLRFAHEALRSPDPDMLSRGAMALSYACELNSGRGCYEYALMTWWGAGVAYQASEVEYGFARARELGEPMAQRGYASLLTGAATESLAKDSDTTFHQSAACSLGIVAACGGPAQPAAKPSPLKPSPKPIEPAPAKPVEIAKPVEPEPIKPEPAKPIDQPVVAKPAARGAQKIVDVQASGGVSKDSARQTIEGANKALTACYEQELAADPKLSGKLVAQIGVDEGGAVRGVRMDASTLQSDAARDCMGAAIRQWRFAPAQNKMTSLVVYTAEFTRAAAR